jgi:hypothetical protein
MFPVDGVHVFITFEETRIYSFNQRFPQHIDMDIEYSPPTLCHVDTNRYPYLHVVLTASRDSMQRISQSQTCATT